MKEDVGDGGGGRSPLGEDVLIVAEHGQKDAVLLGIAGGGEDLVLHVGVADAVEEVSDVHFQ